MDSPETKTEAMQQQSSSCPSASEPTIQTSVVEIDLGAATSAPVSDVATDDAVGVEEAVNDDTMNGDDGSSTTPLSHSTPTIINASSRRISQDSRRSSQTSGSFRIKGTNNIWTQLARRSTYIEGRRYSSNASDDDAAGAPPVRADSNGARITQDASPSPSTSPDSKSSPWFKSITTRYQSLSRSIKKASKHPYSIVLPTILTFAILTTAGLFAIIHSSQQYHEGQSLALLEESRELAYELDDLLSQSLLPLFTLKEMAGQFDEFQGLQTDIVESSRTYLNEGGRSFRNVTEICTNPEVMELYDRAAESIVQSSKMGKILLNVQLQPAGTICLNHPHFTTYPNGHTMDHTKAIGLDRIHDKYQRDTARASIGNEDSVAAGGPIVLVQDTDHETNPHETLLYFTPIFMKGFELVTLDDDGERFEDFWGFAEVLLDWHEILKQIKLHEFFEERNMRFALVEVVTMEGEGGDDKVTEDKVVESSNSDPPLTRDTAREEVLPLQARENWELLVDTPPPNVNDPAWAIWGSVLVILGSFLVSLALMVVLVSRKDHEELLCRCIPHNIVRRLHAGETVIEKYDNATICLIDIVSFTTMSGRMKAHEVMEMLQILFREFDRLTKKHNCFNAETIGDAYITVSGGSEGNDASTGAANIAAFALGAVDVVKKLEFQDGKKIKIRVGVASGPVVAGVIGTVNVPKFTLFGETTSRAEEMEKTSLPLQIQCSEETMKLLRSNFRTNNSFRCKRRKDGRKGNSWWIVCPSEGNDLDSSELDDIAPVLSPWDSQISTVNSTTLTQSEQGQSVVSTVTEESKKYMLAAGEDAHDTKSVRSSLINASGHEFEHYLMSDNNAQAKPKTRLQTSLSNVNIPLRSIGRTFRVATSNKRILFSTFLTFAILCGTGLAILFIFGDEYEKDKYKDATDLANKADRWLEKEIAKALLPLFAMSELVKVVGKWYDLPFKIEKTQQYDKGTSIYNNVTGICDDPAYVDPFVDIASSIKNSSGLQGILVNVQLAPSGVLCLTYPKNNTEDFDEGVYLDTSGAIGLNLFNTSNREKSSKAAVVKKDKTVQGPIKLAQGNLSVVDEALIARYPVFVDGHNMTIYEENYPLWGLTIVLMDWNKLKSKFDIYNFFDRAYMQFRMTRYDSWNERLVVIANSSDHEILDDHNSISLDLKASDDGWTLMVGFNDGFSPPWLGWGTACVIVGSMLLSLLVMVIMVTTKMNKMLLYRMMPREAILAVEQGKTFVERDSEATIFFAHLIGFEKMSGEMSSKDFLLMLTQLYTEFDKLVLMYHCTKIETIGAYYIVKDKIGHGEREGVERIALFALHAMELVRNYQYKGVQFQIRAGFATGPIVAGVIGSGGLPKYTVFGDTVNFASRMESTSQPMMIQCPFRTCKLLRNSAEFIFDMEEREEEGEVGVYVKGKGQTMTYWLKGYTAKSDCDTGEGDTSVMNKEVNRGVPSDLDLDIEAMGIRDKRVSFQECEKDHDQ
ncbi:hypothetical protein ACHAXR_008133 [Thalassiosira sp. AJA248-18]